MGYSKQRRVLGYEVILRNTFRVRTALTKQGCTARSCSCRRSARTETAGNIASITSLVAAPGTLQDQPLSRLKPVTMQGQKFEIPEDPSQTSPGWSPMGPILYIYFLNFPTFRKKSFLAAILANICLRNSQADLGLDRRDFVFSTHFVRRKQRQRREL